MWGKEEKGKQEGRIEEDTYQVTNFAAGSLALKTTFQPCSRGISRWQLSFWPVKVCWGRQALSTQAAWTMSAMKGERELGAVSWQYAALTGRSVVDRIGRR